MRNNNGRVNTGSVLSVSAAAHTSLRASGGLPGIA